MGNVFSRIRREVHDVLRNCRAHDEDEDVKTIISDYSTLERDRRKCAEKSPNIHLQRHDSDTGEEWKSMVLYTPQTGSDFSPHMDNERMSKTEVSSVCSTPLIIPGRTSLATTIPSSRENSNYSLYRELGTFSDDSDDVEIFTKAGLRARYTLTCPDRESLKEKLAQTEKICEKVETCDEVQLCEELETQNSPLESLEHRQEEVLKRLGVLQERYGQLSKKYNLSSKVSSANTSVGTNPTTLESGKLHDMVVNIDPSSIPYSLLVFYSKLCQHYKVLANVHVHSSAKEVPLNMSSLFKNGPIQFRKDYQMCLTLIWKKVDHGPVLMIDPVKQVGIEGEVNIAKYLQRILDTDYDLKDVTHATQIDEWLSMIQVQYLDGTNKERAGVLRSLNAHLGQNDWLVGNGCSLADIVMWSALQQTGQTDKVPNNVKKWLTNCSAISEFSQALSYVQ